MGQRSWFMRVKNGQASDRPDRTRPTLRLLARHPDHPGGRTRATPPICRRGGYDRALNAPEVGLVELVELREDGGRQGPHLLRSQRLVDVVELRAADDGARNGGIRKNE